jgi:N-acetylneuraminic acid mutarotase
MASIPAGWSVWSGMRRVILSTAIAVAMVLAGNLAGAPAALAGTGTPGPALPAHKLGSWSVLADFPQERTEVGAVALDGVVYVAGGFVPDPAIPADAFYAYHPTSDTWQELAPIPYELVHHAPLAAYDGAVYLIGGFAPDQPTNEMWVYDVASDTWSAGPPMPFTAGAHAVATTPDGAIHVVGGVTLEPAVMVTDRHLVFDIATQTWSTLAPMPTARDHHGAAYLHGTIYVAGGRGPDSHGAEFEAYHLRTGTWRKLPDLPTARGGIAVEAFRGQIYVLGGETFDPDRTYDQVERYHPRLRRWTSVAPMLVARHGLGGAVLDDGIVVVSGGPQAGFTYSTHTEIWRPGRPGHRP